MPYLIFVRVAFAVVFAIRAYTNFSNKKITSSVLSPHIGILDPSCPNKNVVSVSNSVSIENTGRCNAAIPNLVELGGINVSLSCL